MINTPLRQVSTFVCLAETLSFRRAAERLRLSQPAVSAHIRELERQVGVPLVHRTTRQVALTAEGKAFAARASRALAELDLASQDLRERATVHRGRVSVACLVPLMAHVLPNAVRRINQVHPGLDVEIRDVLSVEIDAMVASGEADFGIGPRTSGDHFSFTHLFRDNFVAVLPLGHPLADRDSITLRELTAYPIVTTLRNTSARVVLEGAMKQFHQTLKPRFELGYHFSIGKMVEAGHGVTALPLSVVPNLATSNIVIVEIKSSRIFRDIGLIARREHPLSPAAQALAAVIKAMFAAPRKRAIGARRPAGEPATVDG